MPTTQIVVLRLLDSLLTATTTMNQACLHFLLSPVPADMRNDRGRGNSKCWWAICNSNTDTEMIALGDAYWIWAISFCPPDCLLYQSSGLCNIKVQLFINKVQLEVCATVKWFSCSCLAWYYPTCQNTVAAQFFGREWDCYYQSPQYRLGASGNASLCSALLMQSYY